MAIREKKLDESSTSSGGSSSAVKRSAVSPFRRALEDYRDALHESWRIEDATRRVNEVMQGAPATPTPEQQVELWKKLGDAWFPPEFYHAVNRALTDYVAATKAAWEELDPATATPGDLAYITQLIGLASTFIAIPIDRPGTRAA